MNGIIWKKKGENIMLTKQDIAVLADLLEQGLQPVKQDLQQLRKDFAGLNNKFNGLRQDMNEKIDGLRTEMYQLFGELREEMKGKIDGLREEMHTEITRLGGKIDGLREEMHTEITRLDGKIGSLRLETRQGLDEIRSVLNTDIAPRLKTIEDCYLKTYDRYREGMEKQQKMEDDISVMKEVIQEHSVQIQKLCS